VKIEKIYIGGWFQRTTLHLTEVADFLSSGGSELDLDKEKLRNFRDQLQLQETNRENWLLEYIAAKSDLGIRFRIYEDGLIVLEAEPEGNLKTTFDLLENYYDGQLSPAISYLFSKGAPVPKELAQIKTLLPFIVWVKKATLQEIKAFFEEHGLATYSAIETPYVKVYKAPKIILIVSDLVEVKVRQLVEGQIFFREFKSQLHRYLNLHRLIWEEIAAIKERGKIAGKDVKALRSKLDDYQKTIQLIDSRIGQMGSYLATRGKISTAEEVDKYLDKVFQYKFETLADTLSYIKELWKMTANYLSSAIEVFKDIQAESTKTSITSLQLITTLGVVAGIIGFLGRDKLPNLTTEGVVFFIMLAVLTWVLNAVVTKYFASKSYIIKKDNHTKAFKLKETKEENS